MVCTLGELALARGDLAEAESRFRGCLVLAASDALAAEALGYLGIVAAHRSQPVRALRLLRAADYALDVSPASRDQDPAHPLSRRELEVVRLVARGLSDRAIAAQLRISERTVEGHLAHARDKLDLHSRVQLAAWVAAEAGAGTD